MLKYLFAAQFNDGAMMYQTHDDVSELDKTKSKFYDVLQKEKEVPLIAFALQGEGNQYTVDLRDGHFEINGVPFFLHEDPAENIRLVFFRRHTHDFNADSEEENHTVEYYIGWQGNKPVTGENVKHLINIS
jgi:hypothetical protein